MFPIPSTIYPQFSEAHWTVTFISRTERLHPRQWSRPHVLSLRQLSNRLEGALLRPLLRQSSLQHIRLTQRHVSLRLHYSLHAGGVASRFDPSFFRLWYGYLSKKKYPFGANNHFIPSHTLCLNIIIMNGQLQRRSRKWLQEVRESNYLPYIRHFRYLSHLYIE